MQVKTNADVSRATSQAHISIVQLGVRLTAFIRLWAATCSLKVCSRAGAHYALNGWK